MSAFFQNITALLIVAIAFLSLARRFYKFVTRAGQGDSTCGSGCDGCSSEQADIKPLVQLDASKPV